MSDLFDRTEQALYDFYTAIKARDEEAGAVVLSRDQYKWVCHNSGRGDRLCPNGGKFLLFGLRIIIGENVAGPLIVTKSFIAAMSWYPKLYFTLQGGE